MPAWLSLILRIVLPPLVREWLKSFLEAQEEKKAAEKKAAELEQSKEALKKDMKEAGEDEKAQENAYDDFFNRNH